MTSSRHIVRKTILLSAYLLFVAASATVAQAIRPFTLAEALQRVDDDGSEQARIGFRINFFGINYDSVWVNNNGNLTFNASLWTYTPYMIQQNSAPMFAPFFADVDTRTVGDVTRYGWDSLEVTPGNMRRAFIINWVNVGCFALSNSAIVNSFQLIIVDRSDVAPGDFDLEYNYDKIIWEAGTMSGGNSSGLGGSTTASMGWSNGTNTYYSHTGSLQAGAFLNAGPRSLILNRLNSTVNGRYCFFVRNGVVVDLLGPQTFSVRETARPPAFVGRVATTTFYPRAGVTFSIVPPALPEFTLATDSSGVIRVAAGTRLDYETRNQYTFRAAALYQAGGTVVRDTALMTINIIDVEPEQFMRDTAFVIREDAAIGALVGTITAPLVANPRFTIAGVSTDFALDPTGNLRVAAGLDYDLHPQYQLTVVGSYVNSGDTLYDTAIVTVNISVVNQPQPPDANAGSDQTVPAGASCDAVVTLNGSGSYDPDGGAITSYTWQLPVGGPLTGATPDATFPLGTSRVILRVVDNEGSSDTDTVLVTVIDRSAPNIPTLTAARGECSVTLTAPTTNDNCSGTITGTTDDSTHYSTPGTYTVTWHFTDAEGNSSTAEQLVVVQDLTPPVQNVSVLSPITGECSVTITEADRPTAHDNCVGTVIAKTNDPVVYNDTGTFTIRWVYTDLSGNSTTQTQEVIVRDVTPPVPAEAILSDVIAECSVRLTPPRANDQCSGLITGTTPNLVFSSQGDFPIQWTYTDARNNSVMQNQMVRIHDRTPPVITSRPDTTVHIPGTITGIVVQLPQPRASDACLSTIVTGRRSDGLSLGEQFPVGTTTVWWKACDAVGNGDSIMQRVTVSRNTIPVVNVIADTAMDEGTTLRIRVSASDADGITPRLTAVGLPSGALFTDSGNGIGLFSWNIGCDDHGVYSIAVRASDGIDSVAEPFILTIRDLNFAPRFLPNNDTTVPENAALSMLIRSEDCDGEAPRLRAVSIPSGSTFQDNGDGTASLRWTPDCDDNGYYIFVFEAADDLTAVRDTIIVRITDVNCYRPQMTLSAVDLTSGLNLPISITVRATDRDGGSPALQASNLPAGANFAADNEGNGVLSWTPAVTGTFTPTITAIDNADATVRVDTTITLRVTGQNFTGPTFRPCSDTIIDENQQLELSVAAEDPDRTTPTLTAVSLPSGATFIDNRNGSGAFSWQPGCAMHGNHYFTARATDGALSDTVEVLIVVRDRNCAPVINPVTDKNIAYGSTLRFSVSATDPDDDATPDISVACALPGFTFTIPERGRGVFEWNATYTSGSYPVTFYATDGELTDTETVIVSINTSGTLHIVATPSSAQIYSSPAPGLPGVLAGTGSAAITGVPGTFWFAAKAPGYRTTTFTGTIASDVTCTLAVALRPSIPCMFAAAESVTIGSSANPGVTGSIAFVDFDGDGLQDLSVAAGRRIGIFTGSDGAAGVRYRSPAIAITVPATLDSIVAHTYADWNNDGRYECILSLAGGKISVASFDNETIIPGNVVIERAGETLFPTVTDIDGDRRKDLVVVARDKGVFLYLNSGTDQAPTFGEPVTVTDAAAAPVTALTGTALIADIDGDGLQDIIAGGGSCMRFFTGSGDSTLRHMPAGEDLNAGGGRISVVNGSSCALLMVPKLAPRLAVISGGRINVYRLRLLGDVTADGTVNIADISKIAKSWEKTAADADWNPACNIRLSASGTEVIDIKDISRASKNWELQE